MLALLLSFFLAVNALTIFRFAINKEYARSGLRRIPESDLLLLAFIGGSPGALLARKVFRHKTRKEPFSTHLMVIVFVHVVAVGATAGFLLAG